MLFFGTSDHTLDAKLRLAIPAKHRYWGEGQGPSWVSIPVADKCVRLYPESLFIKLADHGGDSLTSEDDIADFETNFYSSAERLEMDSSHRVIVPRAHLDDAAIEIKAASTEIVLVGAKNRVEVWEKAKWTAGQAERRSRLPVLMKRVEQEKRANQG